MDCPKCKKDTCVLVTAQNKKKERQRRGLVWTVIGAPVWLVKTVWRVLFGKRENFEKKQHWHCNYCGHDFKQDFSAEAES